MKTYSAHISPVSLADLRALEREMTEFDGREGGRDNTEGKQVSQRKVAEDFLENASLERDKRIAYNLYKR